MNDYSVEITSEGRSGEVIYKEKDGSLNFWWEFGSEGAFISIPSDKRWNAFCEAAGTNWAKDRKPEIVERVAAETRRLKASSAVTEISDEWINLRF